VATTVGFINQTLAAYIGPLSLAARGQVHILLLLLLHDYNSLILFDVGILHLHGLSSMDIHGHTLFHSWYQVLALKRADHHQV